MENILHHITKKMLNYIMYLNKILNNLYFINFTFFVTFCEFKNIYITLQYKFMYINLS